LRGGGGGGFFRLSLGSIGSVVGIDDLVASHVLTPGYDSLPMKVTIRYCNS